MSDKMHMLVTHPLLAEHRQQLEAAAPAAAFTYKKEAEVIAEEMAGVDALFGTLPAVLLAKAGRLRWMQLASSGAGAYAEPGVLPGSAVLTTATGAYGRPVAEHAFAMWLALQKKLHLYRDGQNAARWRDEGPVQSPAGAVVLLVGLGDIGQHFGRMASALGARIIGVRRRSGGVEGIDEVHTLDALDSLLPRADVVLLSLPETPETRGLFGAARLARMKKEAILLNVGRGSAVDADALCDAVEDGALFAAGLDVTDPEPLPVDHRLWRVPGILLTPHISGGFHLPGVREAVVAIAADNLKRFAAGQPLRNVVPAGLGYAGA